MSFEKIFKAIIVVVLLIIIIRLFLYIVLPPKIELVFQRGDTIFEFSQLLGVRARNLMKYNKIKNPRSIPVGTKISSPIPITEYIKYRLGLEGKFEKAKRDRDFPPLQYGDGLAPSGIIFYSSDIVKSPDPQIYCGDYLVIGHLFLEDRIRFDFVDSDSKIRMFELVGENPVLCKLERIKNNKYEIPQELAAEFWSVWNNFSLDERMIVFYIGDL